MRVEPGAAGDALRRAFSDHLVEDERANPNFSLQLASDATELHLLYRGACIDARSSDPGRVVASLLRQLDAFAGAPAGTIQVHGSAIVHDGAAMIIPPTLREVLPDLGRRLERHGVLVFDGTVVSVDPERAELVVEPQLAVHEDALAELVAAAPCRRPEASVTPGRYPVVRWMFADLWHEGVDGSPAFSRATAVRRAAPITVTDTGAAPPFERLAGLFARVEAVGVDPQDPDEVLQLLVSFPA